MTTGCKEDVSRRGFIRRAMAVGLVVVFGDHLVDGLLRLQNRSGGQVAFAEVSGIPGGEKPCTGHQCFSSAERGVLEALVAVVIPSDEIGPGAKEAGVAAEIERMLKTSPRLLRRYSDGLQAFDKLAGTQYHRGLAALPYDKQVELFAFVKEAKDRLWPETDPQSLPGKFERKLHHWYYRRYIGVTDPMMVLMDQLMRDASESFYATKLAWDSLGYSGPPFPFGYAGRKSHCALVS